MQSNNRQLPTDDWPWMQTVASRADHPQVISACPNTCHKWLGAVSVSLLCIGLPALAVVCANPSESSAGIRSLALTASVNVAGFLSYARSQILRKT